MYLLQKQTHAKMSTSAELTDSELLAAYARSGDKVAFETLARRHVDMIFAVSLRRSRNRQLAEEATQNVLLSLSRKAKSLSVQDKNLTGWLHRSTRFEVANLLRRESRLQKREQAYAAETMNTETQNEDETFQRLYPLLDQAIDHLVGQHPFRHQGPVAPARSAPMQRLQFGLADPLALVVKGCEARVELDRS